MNLMSLKVTAFSVHLIVGFLILSAVYAYVRYNWFPGGLFELENVWSGLKILLIVDLVLGPLLTFIVYNPK